jgi:hypothetical protein
MGSPDYAEDLRRARHAIELAKRSEKLARLAAERADRADRQHALGRRPAGPSPGYERIAEAHRRAEECQRRTAEIYRSHARHLVRHLNLGHPEGLPPSFMAAVADAASWHGAVLALTDPSGTERLVAASDSTARRAHELEMTVAEGPSLEAMTTAVPVIGGALLERRWPRYGPLARDLGVQVVAATPLPFGADGVGGSLTVFDTDPPGPAHESSRLSEVAEALTMIVLHAVERFATDADASAMEPFAREDFQPALHQAAGVLRERRGWSINDAISLVRAHAFAENRSVAEVADEVLRGELDL